MRLKREHYNTIDHMMNISLLEHTSYIRGIVYDIDMKVVLEPRVRFSPFIGENNCRSTVLQRSNLLPINSLFCSSVSFVELIDNGLLEQKSAFVLAPEICSLCRKFSSVNLII